MTRTYNLTAKSINAMTFNDRGNTKDIRWSDKIKGFGMRLYPSGNKSFVLSYRVNNRKRLMVLGDFGILTVTQAEDKAKKELSKVIDNIDPMEGRDIRRKAGTFEQLASDYIERYAKPRKKTWEQDQARLKKHLLPKFGTLPALSITHNDLAKFHSKIGKTRPYEANRLIELLAVMFKKGIVWGLLPDDFKNPANNIEAFREHKRERWVTPEELPRLAESIDQEQNPYVRGAIWLYLLTGLRKNELLSAKWEYIDWDRKELNLPDTKSGKPLHLPLSSEAITLLEGIPRIENNPYILIGLKEGQHLVNINKPWGRIRARAKVDDVRLHDLRRTVGSWLAQSGNSLHLIGKVLNHSNTATTEVYARFAQDHVREALEAHGKKIMGIAGKRDTAQILDINKA